MSIHIAAKRGEIAETVLLPGDPRRAEHIAKHFLQGAERYNSVRSMSGFTGYYREKPISVQGSGMGQPSLGIYVHELIHDFGVKRIIRVGSCGALNGSVLLRDIVLAQGACTDSNLNRRRFKGLDFAPIASFELLYQAALLAGQMGIRFRVGNVLATDNFYADGLDPNEWKLWRKYGVLAVEMESAELYTLAAEAGIQALSILTVSDDLETLQGLPASDRETSFNDMIELALELI